jgi:hypothetical protein
MMMSRRLLVTICCERVVFCACADLGHGSYLMLYASGRTRKPATATTPCETNQATNRVSKNITLLKWCAEDLFSSSLLLILK